MAETLKACPRCGYQSYAFKDYGKVFEYTGEFGADNEELAAIHDTRPVPVYCYCCQCNKRFKIKDVRGDQQSCALPVKLKK